MIQGTSKRGRLFRGYCDHCLRENTEDLLLGCYEHGRVLCWSCWALGHPLCCIREQSKRPPAKPLPPDIAVGVERVSRLLRRPMKLQRGMRWIRNPANRDDREQLLPPSRPTHPD